MDQEEDLRQIFELLQKHINDNFKDIKRCYVYWQCHELIKDYYEGRLRLE